MAQKNLSRSISATQIIGILALVMIAFFGVAFAGKAIDTYRLRTWRDELQQEITQMERQRDALEFEKQRRETKAWIEQALIETGQIPRDALAVRLVSPADTHSDVVQSPLPLDSANVSEGIQDSPFFNNPNWDAWMRLILNRD